MRRENDINGNILPDGCIMYMPLTQNDVTDNISGASPQLYNSSSMVWDGNMGMWKFQPYPLSGQNTGETTYYVRWINGVNRQLQEFTFLCTINIVNGYTAGPADFPSNYVRAEMDLCMTSGAQRLGLAAAGPQGETACYACQLYNENNSTKLRKYVNGQLMLDYNYGYVLPWFNGNYYYNGCRLGQPRDNSLNKGVFYCKDFYLFDRALTQEQIIEIQGYE